MKVYLAAPYAARDQMRQVRRWMQRQGITVQARWLDEQHELNPGAVGTSPQHGEAYASFHSGMDLEDIHACDVLVAFTDSWVRGNLDVDTSLLVPSGGRHVEFGVALAYGLRTVVVGEPENIFQRGMAVAHVKSLNGLEAVLGTLEGTLKAAPTGRHRAEEAL